MSTMNRLANTKNRFQGDTKKVLCVCSAGLLRSPTAAVVLSQEPFNFNTRACGISDEYALIHIDEVLVDWADEIVCMDSIQSSYITQKFNETSFALWKPIFVLNIPDNFRYRDPDLMEMIRSTYTSLQGK